MLATSEEIPYQRRRFIQMHKELISEDYAFVQYDVGRFTNCLCGMTITSNYIFENVKKKQVVLGSTCAKRYRSLKEAPLQNRDALLAAGMVVGAWNRQVAAGTAPAKASYDVMKRAYYLKVKRLNSALLYVGDVRKFLKRMEENAGHLNTFEKKVLRTSKAFVKSGGRPSLKQLRVLVNADLRISDAELMRKIHLKNDFVDSLREQVLRGRRALTWKQLLALEKILHTQA